MAVTTAATAQWLMTIIIFLKCSKIVTSEALVVFELVGKSQIRKSQVTHIFSEVIYQKFKTNQSPT